jgi:hypothetical protein
MARRIEGVRKDGMRRRRRREEAVRLTGAIGLR